MNISGKDIIHFEMEAKFYYKNCEVTVKKHNQFCHIKIFGISNKNKILEISRTFCESLDDYFLLTCLNGKIPKIEKVYREVKKMDINDKKTSFQDN